MRFVRWFAEVGLADVGLVGGKVASLGEMIRELQPLGIHVPDGFAVTAEGYRHFIAAANLEAKIRAQLDGIAKGDVQGLVARSAEIRKMTPAETASFVRAENARWVKVVKDAGIQPQ